MTPSKITAAIKAAIAEFNLAEIVDEVLPYGSIMAGELPKFWLNGNTTNSN